MSTSPTQRSLAHFRKIGWIVQVTERWNPFAHIRQDLFGFCDILCIRPGEIMAVQATSSANVAARIAKIKGEPRAEAWIRAGGTIVVIGWAKRGKGARKLWTPMIRPMRMRDEGGLVVWDCGEVAK